MGSIVLCDRGGTSYHVLYDDQDQLLIDSYNWTLHRDKRGYIYVRRWLRVDGKIRWVFMHTDIMRAPKKCIVHHKNRSGLDNRRENLVIASYSQNIAASKKFKRIKLGNDYMSRGVTDLWVKGYHYFKSQIGVNGVQIYLGCFKTNEEASEAYKVAAKKYFGEFSSVA